MISSALSVLFALVTSGATPRDTPAPQPVDDRPTVNLLSPSVYVDTFEDEDCTYTIIWIRGLTNEWVPVWGEYTCTEYAPDEPEDW